MISTGRKRVPTGASGEASFLDGPPLGLGPLGGPVRRVLGSVLVVGGVILGSGLRVGVLAVPLDTGSRDELSGVVQVLRLSSVRMLGFGSVGVLVRLRLRLLRSGVVAIMAVIRAAVLTAALGVVLRPDGLIRIGHGGGRVIVGRTLGEAGSRGIQDGVTAVLFVV